MKLKIFCRCSLFRSWLGQGLISTPVLALIKLHVQMDQLPSQCSLSHMPLHHHSSLGKEIVTFRTSMGSVLQAAEQMLSTFERKILRRIYSPTQKGGCWRPRWNNELYTLYKEPNIMEDIQFRRLGWAGHIPKTVLN